MSAQSADFLVRIIPLLIRFLLFVFAGLIFLVIYLCVIRPKQKTTALEKRFCTKCGSEITPNEHFCPKCGNKLR